MGVGTVYLCSRLTCTWNEPGEKEVCLRTAITKHDRMQLFLVMTYQKIWRLWHAGNIRQYL